MKRNLTKPFFCFSLCLSILAFGCNVEECDQPISIVNVTPAQAPPGYEVLIEAIGIDSFTRVFFANTEATTRRVEEGIIATVPENLNGTTEITLENGNCLDRYRFKIWENGFPPGVPVAPAKIYEAVPALNLPSTFSGNWFNVNDPQHMVCLDSVGGAPPFYINVVSRECHNADAKLLGNVTGSIRIQRGNNLVNLIFDRSEGLMEYDGLFVEPSTVDAERAYAILLWSKETGRQMVLQSDGDRIVTCPVAPPCF